MYYLNKFCGQTDRDILDIHSNRILQYLHSNVNILRSPLYIHSHLLKNKVRFKFNNIEWFFVIEEISTYPM